MDEKVKSFKGTSLNGLTLCHVQGVAYQTDIGAARVAYDAGYLAKCEAYADSPTAIAVNRGRCALLLRHLQEGADVLDVGAGSGAFLHAATSWGFAAKGFDVIPETAARLHEEKLYSAEVEKFEAVTLWDVIEHMEDPSVFLKRLRDGAFLFISVPIFRELSDVFTSKHFRPGEHLYYWTSAGFIAYMDFYGFRLLEESDHETDAGRESIGAFAFCKDGANRGLK